MLWRAIADHKAGKLGRAEAEYRKVLAREPDNLDVNHRLGMLYLQKGDVDVALSFFKIALEGQPSQERFWLSYVDALIKNGRLYCARAAVTKGAALGLSRELVEVFNSNLMAKVEFLENQKTLALNLFSENKFNEVEVLAKDLIEKFPKDEFGWKALGAALYKLGHLESSLRVMRSTLELVPKDVDTLNNMGSVMKDLGLFDEAENYLCQALKIRPDLAEIYNNLANILFEKKKVAAAEANYHQALMLKPNYVDAYNNLSVLLAGLDRVAEAEFYCRKTLELQPDFPGAWYRLGNILKKQGLIMEAETCYRQELVYQPDHVDTYNNMGSMLQEQDRLTEAETCYQLALSFRPDHVEVLYNLGNLLKRRGLLVEAEANYRKALALRPDYACAYNNLGNVLKDQKRLLEAEVAYRQAILAQHDYVISYNNLGYTLQLQGKLLEAELNYRQALMLNPAFLDALNNLGNTLCALGFLEEAELYLRKALALQPCFIEALNNLGNVLRNSGRMSEAEAQYRKAISGEVGFPGAYNNLGNILKDQGQIADALMCFQQAKTLRHEYIDAHSNYLLTLLYADTTIPVAAFVEHQIYGQHTVARIAPYSCIHVHTLLPTLPSHTLRIGWVSADLRRHAVTYFLEPLLQQLRAQGFSLFAYANSHLQDEMTTRIRQHLDGWREVTGMSDAELVAQIVTDQIDILIDLSGHTAGNRLPVFACKPAPVQVTWLGYPATTGVPGMDWRITDVHAEPEGLTEHLNTEKLWRLPEIFCCYQPSPNSPEPLPGLPCETLSPAERVQGLPPELAQAVDPAAQVMTLGCFNNFAKVTPPVITLWSQILSRLPQARLLLEIHGGQDPQFTADVRQRFVQAGARPEQIHIVPRKPEHQYALYRQLDLALDPFPCTGGTTSCDSLWMGVPFVTLAGEWFVGRMGVTLLHNAGLDELIAHSPAEYADKVVALVNDLPRLRAIRHGLRERVAASPIMDSARFGQHFAQALRGMWAASCEQMSSVPSC